MFRNRPWRNEKDVFVLLICWWCRLWYKSFQGGVNYEKEFGESLEEAIKGDFSGADENTYLGLIKGAQEQAANEGQPELNEKVQLTGRKLEQKEYFHHTGYVGGIKSISVAKQLEEHPERVLEKAVQRMLSRNALGRQQMRKLRIFVGPEHTHQAQNPIALDIASQNRKNKRGA